MVLTPKPAPPKVAFMRHGRISGFDGLRALSVLTVFCAHKGPPFLRATNIGHAGVVLFFALSGYLIVGILHDARLAMEEGRSRFGSEFRRFFIARISRICPIYFLGLGVMSLLALAGANIVGWSWDALPWHLAYASNLYEARLGAWPPELAHLWSLSVEWWFYVVAAPLLLLVPARRHLDVCAAIIIAAYGSHVQLLLRGANPIAIHVDSLWNFGFIAMGGLVRLAPQTSDTRMAGRLVWITGPLVLLLGLVPISVPQWIGELRYLLIGPTAALVIYSVGIAQDSRAVRVLEWRPLVWLGLVSYGFYLYHGILPGVHAFTDRFHWRGVPADMLINFAIAAGVAGLSYVFVERPIMARSKRVVARLRARQAAVA